MLPRARLGSELPDYLLKDPPIGIEPIAHTLETCDSVIDIWSRRYSHQ